MNLSCNVGQPPGSVPDSIQPRHVCQQSLGSTDITCGLVSTDVLLSGLKSQAIGKISLSIPTTKVRLMMGSYVVATWLASDQFDK